MSEQFYSIKDWSQFQHYTDRNPPWVKLHREILTGRTWLKANDLSRVVQVASIALAARYENKIPLDWEVLQPAMGLRCSKGQFMSAIEYLTKADFITIQHATNGEDILAQDASAALAKCYSEAEAEVEKKDISSSKAKVDPEKGFSEFWKLYPRKVAKGQARKAFVAAISKGAVLETILAGATRYIAERSGQEDKFTKHPATWLNAECWTDGAIEAPAKPPPGVDPVEWFIKQRGLNMDRVQ